MINLSKLRPKNKNSVNKYRFLITSVYFASSYYLLLPELKLFHLMTGTLFQSLLMVSELNALNAECSSTLLDKSVLCSWSSSFQLESFSLTRHISDKRCVYFHISHHSFQFLTYLIL